MKCRVCGAELEELTMYCTQCGARQYERRPQEVELIMPDAKHSRIVVHSYDNMTKALTKIRDLTGLTVPEVNAALRNLPAELVSGLDEQTADEIASELEEAGVHVTVEGKKSVPEAVIEEAEPAAVEEPAAEPEIVEEPVIEPEIAEPEIIEEPVVEPEIIEEPAAEPEDAEEPDAEPETDEEPVIEPEIAEEAVIEPEIVEEQAAEPEAAEEPAEENEPDGIELTMEPSTFEEIAAEIELIDESMHYGKKDPDDIVLTGVDEKLPAFFQTEEKKEDSWSDFEKEMNEFMKKNEE